MAGSATRGGGPCTRELPGPDGVSTVVHDFGGDGPLVLFAHATGMHGLVWKPVADHLVDRAHCIALDLRGHGDSALPPGSDPTWDGFGRDVLSVARELGAGGIIGVGHSLGGAALLMAELDAPGTFQRLFLYEPAVQTEIGDGGWDSLLVTRDAMVERTSRPRATFPSRAEALANYVSKPPTAQFQAAVLGAYVSHGFSDRIDGAEHMVVLKCPPDTEARIYAGSYDHDTPARLHAITCPVTLSTGAETDALQRRTIEALAAQFGAEPVVLCGVDHFGPMQQPKQFADAVARHTLDR
jgi:pimeloyl-ACP methyl ester carboxylesterase